MEKKAEMPITGLTYDHLGSVTTITNSSGAIVQELSYDAWGSLYEWKTENGERKTFHFPLSAFHFAMYDSVMSSFLSVDRFFQDPSTSQGFNRYAYCMYNPLRYVDPTGFYMTSGNRHHPDDPPHEIIDGQVVFWLPEVTITPYDEPPVTVNESPYSNTTSGGGSHFDWSDLINNNANGSTIGQGGGVNIGYGSNHNTQDNNGNNDSDLEIASDVLVTIGTYTMIKSAQYYNRLTRTWRDKLDITRSFDFHGNGATGGMNSFGKAMSNRYGKVGRALGFAGATMSFYQFEQATTIDGKFEYGFDTFIGLAGVFLPQFFGLPSTIWFLGGKQVAYGYARTTIIPMIEQGINPGLMEYQPFK